LEKHVNVGHKAWKWTNSPSMDEESNWGQHDMCG